MKTTWQANWKVLKEYSKLTEDVRADVVIIGGGITGILTAYLLGKEGKKVVVLEQGILPEWSTTAYTTAFLTYQIDTRLQDLEKMLGQEESRRVWQSGREAIDLIEKIINEESIDCDFSRCPLFFYSEDQKKGDIKSTKEVRDEIEAGKKTGFDVEIKTSPNELGFFHGVYGIFKDQAKFHPLKFCDGLRIAAEKYGVSFFEHTPVSKLENIENKVVAYTPKGNVVADWSITATYVPFDKPRELFAKKGMYKSYIMELAIPPKIFPEGLYISTEEPYHYFRVDRGESADRMVLGGEDHRIELKMKEERNYSALEDYAKQLLNGQKYQIITKWDGSVLESVDGLPFIGPYSQEFPNRLTAFAFSGNGMTYAGIAALIFTDHIMGRHNDYALVYHPRRKYTFGMFFKKLGDYTAILFGGAVKNFFRK